MRCHGLERLGAGSAHCRGAKATLSLVPAGSGHPAQPNGVQRCESRLVPRVRARRLRRECLRWWELGRRLDRWRGAHLLPALPVAATSPAPRPAPCPLATGSGASALASSGAALASVSASLRPASTLEEWRALSGEDRIAAQKDGNGLPDRAELLPKADHPKVEHLSVDEARAYLERPALIELEPGQSPPKGYDLIAAPAGYVGTSHGSHLEEAAQRGQANASTP